MPTPVIQKKKQTHEAKSHLTVVSGYLQLLMLSLNKDTPDIAKAKEIVEKGLVACDNLANILENLDSK